ncbi:DNA-binding response regulator [Paenibacillus chitinolyticus]|uniref:DNA-binding response regulator n=1 Tax=Paenibacillus chitinolyticus TaxID=79263 RepID=A0A410WPZ6_9BACL|nr:response regulator transcription factor [Paenibacillus chitinolyticus]MCY9591003.1 response regulator transcription factor [Paenibacillus chitinolyticus]MCY9597196.1 response regulator transcription factor [Paenibacillus chitinolyticus]QAV16435.1 DNA-binding response regulator [Paenibacillus chitinolyticus]
MKNGKGASVLIIDDEPEIRDIVQIFLKNEGYEVMEAEDGAAGLELLRKKEFDLIILDVMMPRLDGIQACMQIRQTRNTPIIMLSAKNEDIDKILGLTSGADDYLSKPFNPLELVARVKSQLRRVRMSETQDKRQPLELSIGDLVLNIPRHQVTIQGKDISLTPLEFDILELLATHRGHVFSVDKIYETIWKDPALQSDKTVMVHIRNLREKLKDNPREPKYIKTVWGVGYKID